MSKRVRQLPAEESKYAATADINQLPDELIRLIIASLDDVTLACLHFTATRYRGLIAVYHAKYEFVQSAVRHGYGVVVDWGIAMQCRVEYDITVQAAYFGRLELLKRLEPLYPYAPHDPDRYAKRPHCEAAAENGQLTTLQWLRANGYPWTKMTSWYAAAGGHLDTLRWLVTQCCPMHHDIMRGAVAHDQAAVVEYLHTELRMPLTAYYIDIAINYESHDVYALLCRILGVFVPHG